MSDLAGRLALKQRLPRTWGAFFERHGNFTAVQLETIPLLLDGADVLVCSHTASGKTEAALAPLLERHCPPTLPPATLCLLYLTPTKALVSDLAQRLQHPLAQLGLSLGVKTRDSTSFPPQRPPHLLITTPESTDALLANHGRIFAQLRGIVVDEFHLFTGTARGDQVQVLLNRLRQVRAYAADQGEPGEARIQIAALSATPAGPASLSNSIEGARIVRVSGQRQLEIDWLELGDSGSAALHVYLATFRERGLRKALVFCNSRMEVEATAATIRASSPFGSAVYVHYSNLAPQRRRSIEQQFAQSEAAICVASSTLELGIDIGTIDMVILIGPPGSHASLLQRIGRGSRRQGGSRLACVYRTSLERRLFEALLLMPASVDTAQPPPFRPAVAVQQMFSLLKQSPTGALRLAELAKLFAGMLESEDLEALLGQLRHLDYLTEGRPGDWCAGPELRTLLEQQARATCPLSIHSNITTASGVQLDVRDQHTHEIVARIDSHWLDRSSLTLEGRAVAIEWSDGQALWVSPQSNAGRTDNLVYRSTRQLLSYDLARQLPRCLGLPADIAPWVSIPSGWYWFHWLGDIYGRVLFELLRPLLPVSLSDHPGLCLGFAHAPQALPIWSAAQVARHLEATYRRLEPLFDLGPFQHLVPAPLRRRSVVEHFQIERFLAALTALRPITALESLAQDLMEMVD